MDSEQNILNDVAYAYSPDGGESWSSPVKVNDDTARALHYHRGIGWLGADRDGQSIVGWIDARTGTSRAYMAALRSFSDTVRQTRAALKNGLNPPALEAFAYRVQRVLLEDSFTTNPSLRWKVQRGMWVWKDRMFIGYGAREACAFTGSELWNDYEFTGKFKPLLLPMISEM